MNFMKLKDVYDLVVQADGKIQVNICEFGENPTFNLHINGEPDYNTYVSIGAMIDKIKETLNNVEMHVQET